MGWLFPEEKATQWLGFAQWQLGTAITALVRVKKYSSPSLSNQSKNGTK
jgi:hypothetical protein